MKRPGLARTISILSGFALAIPMAIIGFEFLAQGRNIFGIGFLALSLALLVLPEFIISQLPHPRTVIAKKLGRFRRE